MKKKRKYFVSLLNAFKECVFSDVVSSCSAVEAVVTFVLTFSVFIGKDAYSRFDDCEFTVSCCPFTDSYFSGGD